MRCCGSVHEYTVCRNTTYGEVYKCFSLLKFIFSRSKLSGKSRILREGNLAIAKKKLRAKMLLMKKGKKKKRDFLNATFGVYTVH